MIITDVVTQPAALGIFSAIGVCSGILLALLRGAQWTLNINSVLGALLDFSLCLLCAAALFCAEYFAFDFNLKFYHLLVFAATFALTYLLLRKLFFKRAVNVRKRVDNAKQNFRRSKLGKRLFK